MIQNHLMLDDLPYCGKVKRWLNERYGDAQADDIWRKTEAAYAAYLNDLPYYGGKKNGHAYAIYGGLLIFSLIPSLPDRPPQAELQDFVQKLCMEPFIKH